LRFRVRLLRKGAGGGGCGGPVAAIVFGGVESPGQPGRS
jgi:hypothetical protein